MHAADRENLQVGAAEQGGEGEKLVVVVAVGFLLRGPGSLALSFFDSA